MSKDQKFTPYIASTAHVPEMTARAIILGMILSLLFGIGNAYLGLKTGTTVSASIPAAILSMTILRIFFKRVSILENNIVQTIATVGEGVAAGMIFTIPALIFLGEHPSILRIFLLSSLGGVLGILFMIPMRRYVVVQEHKTLPFPEGTACAEILKAGEAKNHTAALLAGWGFLVGILYKSCMNIFFFWKELPKWDIPFLKNTQFSIDVSAALLGVGYIIGYRISSVMFAGGLLSWWVIIPLIKYYGVGSGAIAPAHIPLTSMTSEEIWQNYVRYIGAGAVAIGGLLGLIRVIPKLSKTLVEGFKQLLRKKENQYIERTDRDISLAWIVLGPLSIILALMLLPSSMNFFTIILLIILSFFFVAVTSITVGIVGSTSNPSSGMTLTTLLITCLIFSFLGWTERFYLISAISMSCIANIAITMSCTTSQDLKTGFLLGATPKSQQIAEIFAVFIPTLVVGFVIYLLHDAYTLGSSKMPAPQATLIALIAKALISKELPVLLVMIGVVLGLIIALLRVPLLPFALGLYLPLSLNSAIIVGGLVHWFHERRKNYAHAKEQGILIASGLIGGDALIGVGAAALTIFGIIPVEKNELFSPYASIGLYLLLAFFLFGLSLKKKEKSL